MTGRPNRRWALLAAVYVSIAIVWIGRAPGGAWTNRVFDFDMWGENDPGGWYIPAAHELFSGNRTVFPGHPGSPLVWILAAIQAAVYAFSRLAGASDDLTNVIVRNVDTVWIVAKLTMVALHVASFFALFEYARLVTRRRELAGWAVVVYATSFPVLFYLTRVSVEPLMNLFFLLTAIGVARAERAPADSRRPEMWAAIAGVCAVSAFFAKLHLMALWPLVAAAALATGFRRRPDHSRRRCLMLGAYAAAGLVTGGVYSASMDWSYFWACWRQIRDLHAASSSSVVSSSASSLVPALTRSNCFFLFEGLAAAALVIGGLRFVRRRTLPRRMMAWMAVYGLFVVAVWFYRSKGNDFHGFHYLFPMLAALAPLLAMGMEAIVTRSRSALDRRRHTLRWAAAILLLHGPGAAAVVSSKEQDARAFRENRLPHYFAALERLSAGERAAVIGAEAAGVHGLTDSLARPETLSTLVRRLDRRFVWIPAPPDPGAFRRTAAKQSLGLVIDFTLADPGPWPLEDWLSREVEGLARARR
jgi:hypothetical protein